MTPEELFAYVDRFARRAEKAGKGTQYPTYRQVAKRFNVKHDDIEEAIDDYQGDGYLGSVVGYRTGGGWYGIETRGARKVEAYSD